MPRHSDAVVWITTEYLFDLHQIVAEMFEGTEDPLTETGERTPGLADAAVNRPLAQFSGTELYKTDREKVAALVHAINSSHAFRDGNKRTSLAALVVILDNNRWRLEADDKELSDFLIAVATPTADYSGDTQAAIRAMTAWIRAHTKRKSAAMGTIGVDEFLSRCERVGGSWKKGTGRGGSYVVWGTKGSVKFSQSTSSLDPGVVKSYLSTLGLTEAYTGIPDDEFIDGRLRNMSLMTQYREALAMLARHDRSYD